MKLILSDAFNRINGKQKIIKNATVSDSEVLKINLFQIKKRNILFGTSDKQISKAEIP